jgi:adenine-specific DNA methylase
MTFDADDQQLHQVLRPGSSCICADSLCRSVIESGHESVLDSLTGRWLCVQCGTCLRYARKKALERGEVTIPLEY